ncbi:ribonuclease Z [Halorussus limi]|uniref:Ribonuclease Z n=2 Tax=Halorussus TaxID=1070314 RepID=A0A8U0IFZ0_9EURY|nr:MULTISPECIES: ribonuclease Z [Halorussus]UPV73885.1 ribonuclease Z [Halorussus limi]UPV99902.1 ribonuclease Z [Halorussus gelatinilyticus]
MDVTFLGTSGAIPTTERNPSAILLRREGERFLFDVGEGTQRQMMRFSTGFDIDAILLTHLHGDHVLGLPGLLQTLDFNERTASLPIYTPAGTADTVAHLLKATKTNPIYPVPIHEVSPGDAAVDRDEYTIRAFETNHRTISVGYALIEAQRKGRFNRKRAEELGVPVGPKFQQLHEGTPVELDDGTVVYPEQVVGDPRPGRRVVYTGDTRPTDTTVSAATDADLLIHEAMFASDRGNRAKQTGHSTSREAAEIARQAGVDRLALTHISSRYSNETEQLETEASELVNTDVCIPADGESLTVPYPDSD